MPQGFNQLTYGSALARQEKFRGNLGQWFENETPEMSSGMG